MGLGTKEQRGSPNLANRYMELIDNPEETVRKLRKENGRKPLWLTMCRGVQQEGKATASLSQCILWLSNQFCVLTPITDPWVVQERYNLHKNGGLKLMVLEEVIKLSMDGVGMMQCNCANAMHWGECPYSLADLRNKGIIVDFFNQGTNDPKQVEVVGQRKKKRKESGFRQVELNDVVFQRR